MNKPYLRDIINDHKNQGEWKIKLSMRINFMSSKDSDEYCLMHTTIDNIEIMIGNDTSGIIKKLFNFL